MSAAPEALLDIQEDLLRRRTVADTGRDGSMRVLHAPTPRLGRPSYHFSMPPTRTPSGRCCTPPAFSVQLLPAVSLA
jgi:hypothetical protein